VRSDDSDDGGSERLGASSAATWRQKMKLLNLIIFFITPFLTACTIHEVDLAGLSSAQDQIFHVRSVELDCYGMARLPSLPLLNCSRDCQLAILNNIPTGDITKKLTEAYGIKIAQDEAFAISFTQIPISSLMADSGDSRAYELSKHGFKDFYEDLVVDLVVGLSTSTAARPMIACFFLQNSTAGDKTNYIDIQYTIDQRKAKGVLGYNISVRTAPYHTLIKHRDEIESFDDNTYFSNFIVKMKETAVKIPSALERDIKAYSSANKREADKIDINPQAHD
jgi:hypothetical protein